MRRFFSLPRLLRYDASLGRIATPQGELSLRKLFLPLFLESFLLNLMGTVNTYVLSFHADASVAAVGSANQLIGLSLTLFSVVSAGASVVISQNLGAKEKRAASDAACFTLLFVGGFSLLLGVGLSFCGKALLRMMKLEGAFLEEAAAYFNIIIRYSFFPAMLTAFSAVFKSCGRPKVSVCVTLGMNALNGLLNYLVIFQPFPIPLEGTRGIALCNVACKFLGFLTMGILLLRAKLGLDLNPLHRHDPRMLLRVLRVGIPGGVSNVSYSLSQVLTTSIIVRLGVAAVSTKIYVSNIVFYVYMFGAALGSSAAILIGWLVGAGKTEQAYRLNMQSLRLAVTMNAVLSLCVFFLGGHLLGLFTADAEIIRIGRRLLAADIAVEVFRAVNHVEKMPCGVRETFYSPWPHPSPHAGAQAFCLHMCSVSGSVWAFWAAGWPLPATRASAPRHTLSAGIHAAGNARCSSQSKRSDKQHEKNLHIKGLVFSAGRLPAAENRSSARLRHLPSTLQRCTRQRSQRLFCRRNRALHQVPQNLRGARHCRSGRCVHVRGNTFK